MNKTIGILGLLVMFTSCSVQQFAVNTDVESFENGGRVFGEKTKGKNFKKDGDIHVLGINVKESKVPKMVTELNTDSYTLETKSFLLIRLISLGMVDYKVVKVIDRAK